jgi:hypothetical protein
MSLRELLLEQVVASKDRAGISSAGLVLVLNALQSKIHRPEFVSEVSEVVDLAGRIGADERSSDCARRLLDVAEAALDLARVLGATEDPSLGSPEPPVLDDLRSRHQARAPADHWYRPIAVDLELTQRCNLRCESCAVIDDVERGYEGMSADQAIEILKSCEGSSIFAYSLVGGEALLRLDDVCRILREVDLDLDRIVTNAMIFGSRRKAEQVLDRLAMAGLGAREQELRPVLSISIGIQTDAGAPLSHPAHLIAQALDTFGDRVALRLGVLAPGRGADLLRALSETYFTTIGRHFPWDRIESVRHMTLEYTPRAARAGACDDRFESVADRFLRDGAELRCPNSERFDYLVAPRCLVRADRSFYACSCFGFVSRLGRVGSLATMIEAANRDTALRAVFEGGLASLFATKRAETPSVGARSIPRAAGVCDVCKAIREPSATIATREKLSILP